MNIWFDLSNSPHINMFRVMIKELQRDHSVTVTCRPLANTIELLEMHGIRHTVVGTHYGRSLAKKIYGFPIRIAQLVSFLRDKKIDVAISQSSFHSPVVARLIGAKSIYMNDNEHAMGNVPAFVFADRIMVPEFLKLDNLRRQGARRSKVLQYPGVKEGIYLWECWNRLCEKSQDRKGNKKPRIFIRPEPSTAQYYKGKVNSFDELVSELQYRARVTVLPRNQEQQAHYCHQQFSKLQKFEGVMDIEAIVDDCDLFIGAGGTMTREMAVLGVPTISVYQDDLLDVDRFLLSENAFMHKPDLTADEALNYLESRSRHPPNNLLLRKGREAYEMVKSEVTNEWEH